MAIRAKTKIKVCICCGHTFEPRDQNSDLSEPYWHPAASNYCSTSCCDQYHLEMVHCCSTQGKAKARREAARAGAR